MFLGSLGTNYLYGEFERIDNEVVEHSQRLFLHESYLKQVTFAPYCVNMKKNLFNQRFTLFNFFIRRAPPRLYHPELLAVLHIMRSATEDSGPRISAGG